MRITSPRQGAEKISALEEIAVQNSRWILILCAFFCLGLPGFLFGQATSSAISGTVRDTSQSVISGAEVSVTNSETGLSRQAQTDSQGRYRIGDLAPGTYQAVVTMAGFSKETQSGISLLVGQEQTLTFTMQVGSVQQEVTVTGAVPLVETTTATVSGNVNQEQMRELPLNGRSFTDLIALQAGTLFPTSAALGTPDYGNGPQLSVAGSRTDQNNFMLDGTDIGTPTNYTPGATSGYQLGVDTIREYQVITSNAKAEYGRNAGGIINAVSRSGTNQWHGGAFEFLRNSDLDARTFFTAGNVLPFRRNQFGAMLGGPIHKDKTFFFLGYEGLRQSLLSPGIYAVPTASARQGIGVTPGVTIPVAASVVPYLNLYPLPNGPILGQGVGDYNTTIGNPITENYGSARLDQNFSEKDMMFGRFTIDKGTNSSVPNLLTVMGYTTTNDYLTLQEDHIFNPVLLNTVRFGFDRSLYHTTLSNVPNSQGLNFAPGQPMGNLGVTGLTSIGPSYIINPAFETMNAFQYSDDVSYTKGAHTMKFGTTMERFQYAKYNAATFPGTITFNNLADFLQAGPVGTGGMLLLPGSNPRRNLRNTLMAFYAQDDYKVTPKLTMNLGLRWEAPTGMNDVQGKSSYLGGGPFLTTYPSGMVIGAYWKNRLDLFSPRFGFNWAPGDQKTSIMGGAGIYYNQLLGNAFISYQDSLPFYERATITNFNATTTFPNEPAMVAASGGGTGYLVTRNYDYYNFKTPTVYRYNLTIKRELPGQILFSVGYVGAMTRHLQREEALNTFPWPVVQANGSLYFPPSSVTPQYVNPSFNAIDFMVSDANADYNALQVSLTKRYSQGLTFQANYTWSKSLDDFSNSESTAAESGVGRDDEYGLDRSLDRGLSTFNAPQVFIFNTVYELPAGPGKHWLNGHGVASAILGGWQTGGILTLQSGVPFTVTAGSIATAGYGFTAIRPNLIAGSNVTSSTGLTPQHWFNSALYTVPPPGTIGDAARDLLIGPGLFTINFSLSKNFAIGERMKLQFRGEFFNVLNHTNFAEPNGGVFSSASGLISPTAGQITTIVGTPRQIQFGLKLTF